MAARIGSDQPRREQMLSLHFILVRLVSVLNYMVLLERTVNGSSNSEDSYRDRCHDNAPVEDPGTDTLCPAILFHVHDKREDKVYRDGADGAQ